MLGAIALTSGSRNMETYVKDMRDRGQSQERIGEVMKALGPYAGWYQEEKAIRFEGKEDSDDSGEEGYMDEEEK